jgi:hypothetical protein
MKNEENQGNNAIFKKIILRNKVILKIKLCLCCWRALACTGLHYRALPCTGVHWRALACTGVHWRALACFGVH